MPQLTAVTLGQQVHVRYTKWGGHAHWEYDQTVLGQDPHGVWTGGGAGTPMNRPGVAFDAGADFVNCFSHRSGWVATFWASAGEPAAAAIYVDITTVPVWSGEDGSLLEVSMVDLDLDVIRRFDGRLFVDDEDEFAEHQVSYRYPADVVTAAEASCRTVLAAMKRAEEPFGAVGREWLAGFERGRLGSGADDGIAAGQQTRAPGQ